jgi:hypothetical protein
MVDIPLATAEGLRAVPKLYGEETKTYAPVTDWKSGFVVGGKSFGQGMVDGFTGLITHPVKGAKEEGALGVVKGLAKGTMGVGVGFSSGMFLSLLFFAFYFFVYLPSCVGLCSGWH